ncbi:MAG: hypothetical protein ACRES4_00905 [Nevskiales bacterium]
MTTKDLLAALRCELPSADLKGLEKLKASDAERLAKLIDQARQQQKAQLKQALQASLDHVPFLLRGTVRRVFSP